MCQQAHRDFHGNCGYFKGWTRDLLREWQTAQVCYFQKLFAIQCVLLTDKPRKAKPSSKP